MREPNTQKKNNKKTDHIASYERMFIVKHKYIYDICFITLCVSVWLTKSQRAKFMMADRKRRDRNRCAAQAKAIIFTSIKCEPNEKEIMCAGYNFK